MATYNRTATGGGTAGHPSNAPVPYVITSPVWDTADGGTGADVIQLIDVPADTMIIAGCLEVLEARGNGQITMDIGFTGGDVDTFLDGSACAAGFSPFLEASIGASGSNCRMLTSADTIDALILDAGSTGESALRFRIHVCMVDVSVNPVESATVSTGT
tara:strand:+ start:564 stop:1040 length:477 start_codon:yes stop_codon:yes gene_type:complete